ncbi:HAD-like domain-containing protein [Dichotomopilus funicola]|uniref:HAD-like domain-containing protein n=1 Tax=Dichotomopilus funicola TaxID=1934379 RepID=A0AAN6VA70_9PEZI|nr:HAD-like domain-containing protein [Dichotomopilus funicola]
MRIFAESPACTVTSRLILMGNANSNAAFRPDYSILENPSRHHVFADAMNSGKKFLISKEELGNDSGKGECLYDVCPRWKSMGWTDAGSLVGCFTNIFRMLGQAPSHDISCLLYERLVLPFSKNMLQFLQPFGSSFLFATERERSIYCEEKPPGLFETVESNSSVIEDAPYHGLLSNTEKDNLEQHLERLYLSCWQSDVLRLRAVLAEKTWISFDLDDTLHEFRRASGAATTKVLEGISKRYGTAMSALKNEYTRILKEKASNSFSDGKTSFQYRKKRSTSVLAHFSIPLDAVFIEELLESYEDTLVKSLELKCGALSLLSAIKDMGKKVAIMTEGPQDAQERTIQALGISQYVDFLATTNHFRLTKTSGLFSAVLGHLGISAGDIAYIGDNEQRDMRPAMGEGIFAVHLAESKHVCLNSFPPQVNTLRKLEYIICSSSPC